MGNDLMSDHLRTQALSRLSELARLKNNWYSVAKTVDDAIKSHGWTPGQAAVTEWVGEAARVVGLTPNTIGRMLAVRDFYDTLAGSPGAKPQGDPDSLPFTSLEILKRIHGVNPDVARNLLDAAMSGKLSSRRLRERYDAVVQESGSSKSWGRELTNRAGNAFEGLVLLRAALDPTEFGCPRGVRVYQTAGSRAHFLPITAVAVDPLRPGAVIGIDAFFVEPRNVEAFLRRHNILVHRMAYAAGFFDIYIAVFPSTLQLERLVQLSEILIATKHENVSIALIDGDQAANRAKVRLVHTGKNGASPSPDCRELVAWAQLIPKLQEDLAVVRSAT